ncbi:LuxR family transcriptional regulator [Flavobacterium longum]|uniref:response regulator transcription factor n=1 Tax=Flavobacterium longum TaxID=1299340 RepID=UPI0039E98FB1
MKATESYHFLIADDHSVVRQGLSVVIRELYPTAKILTSSNFRNTLQIVKDMAIDLLILDISFPEGSSLNIIGEIKNLQPDCKILLFTGHDEDIYAMRFLNAGATGFLNKGGSEEDIRQALHSMMVSGKYVSTNVRNKILDSYINKSPINPLEKLSAREVEVARLLVKGFGNLEISEMLDIRKTTVSTFKNRIYEKLMIDNLAALIELFRLYSGEQSS